MAETGSGPDAVWVDPERGLAGRGPDCLPLSGQEVAALAVLAAAGGRVVGRAELARALGLAPASARRCDQLVLAIRRALGPSAVCTVRRRGWMLAVPVVFPCAP